jgi:hypothetical protein
MNETVLFRGTRWKVILHALIYSKSHSMLGATAKLRLCLALEHPATSCLEFGYYKHGTLGTSQHEPLHHSPTCSSAALNVSTTAWFSELL